MRKHFVAFVDYGNDFGLPEQRLTGPYEAERAKEVKDDLNEVGGVGRVEKLKLDVDTETFPLMSTGDGYS